MLEQASDIHIRIIASLILVRGINTNHHLINQYVLLKIYFPGKRNNKDVRVKIIREAYLIDNLKTKILLNIDIINPEKIDIITFKNQVFIGSYTIIININLKPRARGVTIKSVVIERATTLPSRS